MNTKQRIMGIRLAEKIRNKSDYARILGISINDLMKRRSRGKFVERKG